MLLESTANLLPSAEIPSEDQVLGGILLVIQKVPEFVERYMKPGDEVAAIFVPSAEQATEFQFVLGALVGVQVWANAESTAADRPQRIIATGSRVFIWRLQLLNHFLDVLPSEISTSN